LTDLNILWLTHKGDGYVGAPQTQYGFEMEVAKQCNCKFAGEGWSDYKPNEPLQETVKRVMPNCDWVIDADNALHLPKPDTRPYQIAHFISDIHAKHYYGLASPVAYAQMVNQTGYDKLFLRYKLLYGTKYRPDAFWDWLKPSKHWLPWSVDDKAYEPKSKEIDVAFIGSTGTCYPIRNLIKEGLYYVARGYKVLVSEAPRGKTYERTVESLKQSHIVGENYRNTLGRTRILIFDCSIYRYPLQKLYEAMACKCLAMCNEPGGAKELGFVDGETYVEINEGDWEEKLGHYLENPEKAQRIAYRGMKNVLMNHNHELRAKQFLEVLTK